MQRPRKMTVLCGKYYYEKTCEHCSGEYICQHTQQRFCSKACAVAAVPPARLLFTGAQNAQWNPNLSVRSRAMNLFRSAKRRGDITEASNCEICGTHSPFFGLQGHHQDYTKPLDVNWLCSSCHRRVTLAVRVLLEVANCT